MISTARNHPQFRVATPERYEPAFGPLSKWSDLLVASNIQDANGNTYPDVVLGRRDLLPLPDGKVAFHACSGIAEHVATGGFDPATLGPFLYVRIVETMTLENAKAGFSHGWYSEVINVPAFDIVPGTPAVGDVIFHHEHNTYMERDGYAFVRVARPKDWDFSAGHAAGGA